MADAGRKQAIKDTAAINAEADRMRAEIAKDPEKAQRAYAARDWSEYDEQSEFFEHDHVVTARRKSLAQHTAIRSNQELRDQILSADPGVDPYQLMDAFITKHAEGAEGEFAAEFASKTATMADKSIQTLESNRRLKATDDAKTQGAQLFRDNFLNGETIMTAEGVGAARNLMASSIPNISKAEADTIRKDMGDDMLMSLVAEGNPAAIAFATNVEEFDGLTLQERKPLLFRKHRDAGRAFQEGIQTQAAQDASDLTRDQIVRARLPGGDGVDLVELYNRNLEDRATHGVDTTDFIKHQRDIITLINAKGETTGFMRQVLDSGVMDQPNADYRKILPGLVDDDHVIAEGAKIGKDAAQSIGQRNAIVAQHGLQQFKDPWGNALASSDNAEEVLRIYGDYKAYDAASGQTLEDGGVTNEKGARMYNWMVSQEKAGIDPLLARKQFLEHEGQNRLKNHYANRTEDDKRLGQERLYADTRKWFNDVFSKANLQDVRKPFFDQFGIEVSDNLSWDNLNQQAKDKMYEMFNAGSFMSEGQADEMAAIENYATQAATGQLSIIGVDPNTGEGIVGLNVDPLGGRKITRDMITAGQDLMHKAPGNTLLMNALGGQATLTADAHTRAGVGGLRLGVVDQNGNQSDLALVPGDRAWVAKDSISGLGGAMRPTADMDPRSAAANPMLRIEAEDDTHVLMVIAPAAQQGGQPMITSMSENTNGVYDHSIQRWTARFYAPSEAKLQLAEELAKAAEARQPTPGRTGAGRTETRGGGQIGRGAEHGIDFTTEPTVSEDPALTVEPGTEVPSTVFPLFNSSLGRR
jgi:hypothetical protein